MVDEKELTVCLKKCKICGIGKPLSEFTNEKKARDGKYSWCNDCKNKKQRNRYSKLSNEAKLANSRLRNKLRAKTLSNWQPIIREMYNMQDGFVCQSCGKALVFPQCGNGNNYSQSIYFDHKSNQVNIKGSPTRWLKSHTQSSKNIEIFKSCEFGILCKDCNTRLGSPNNRKKRLLRDYFYVFGGPLNQSSKKAVQLESSGGAR